MATTKRWKLDKMLKAAVLDNDLGQAEVALTGGANPDQKIENKGSVFPLLTLSMFTPAPAMAELLLAHGANIEATDGQGRTALHMAIFPAHAIALISAGAKIQARDPRGDTPLHTTCSKAAAVALVQAGADPWVLNAQGELPWQNLQRLLDVRRPGSMSAPRVHVIEETIAYLRSLVEGEALERDTDPVTMTQAEEAAKAQTGRM